MLIVLLCSNLLFFTISIPILISAHEQTVRLISTCFVTFLEWQISLKFDFILDKIFQNMTNKTKMFALKNFTIIDCMHIKS